MKLTWYGHSCFLAESQSGSIVFDPYAPGTVPGLVLPELEADAVACSHYHSDHGYEEGVRLTGRKPEFSMFRFHSFHDERNGALRGENIYTLIDDGSVRLLHLGDLGHALRSQAIEELGRVDVLLVPIGGYYTIDSAVAIETVKAIKPRIVVPMHFRGEGFGFNVISTAEDFLSMSENVKYFDSNVLEIDNSGESFTAALKCPVD